MLITSQLVGEACQLACPMDHVCFIICVYMFVLTTMLKHTLYWRYINWGRIATGIQAPAGTCKLMNIAIHKYQMLHDVI